MYSDIKVHISELREAPSFEIFQFDAKTWRERFYPFLSQKDLAYLLGLSVKTVCSWERSGRISRRTAFALCGAEVMLLESGHIKRSELVPRELAR